MPAGVTRGVVTAIRIAIVLVPAVTHQNVVRAVRIQVFVAVQT